MKKSKSEPIYFPHNLYILMRTDLPSMNTGKAMAQAAHASNQFIHDHGDDIHVERWQTEGRGFGTTIVLGVDLDTLDYVYRKSMGATSVLRGVVHDTTYPFIVDKEIAALIPKDIQTAPAVDKGNGQIVMFRDELTCAYLFINANSSDREELVGSLSLHP